MSNPAPYPRRRYMSLIKKMSETELAEEIAGQEKNAREAFNQETKEGFEWMAEQARKVYFTKGFNQ
jgi:hypothetical protein